MFEKPEKKPDLQSTIDELFEELKVTSAETEQYEKITDELVKIYNLKAIDAKRKIDINVLIPALLTFAGVVWITRYERENVLATKGLSWLTSFRP